LIVMCFSSLGAANASESVVRSHTNSGDGITSDDLEIGVEMASPPRRERSNTLDALASIIIGGP
jgi:hypothetical protein